MNSGDQRVTQSLVQHHQRLHLNYDVNQQWQPFVSGTQNRRTVQAVAASLRVDDIFNFGILQGQAVVNMFNLYQEFRVASFKLSFIPRYESSQAALGYIQNQPSYQDNTGLPSYVENFFCETAEYILLMDKQDTFVTDNNLDEYYLLRSHPAAITGKTTERRFLAFAPQQYDINAALVSPVATNGGQISGAYQGPAISNGSGSAAANFQTDTTQTEVNAWRSTKVFTGITGSTPGAVGNLVLNTGETLFGWRWYCYTPFNTVALSGSSTVVTVGTFRVEWDLEFRNPEFRPYITSLGLVGERLEEIQLLRKLKGEEYLLLDHNQRPQFITAQKDAIKRTAESAGFTPALDPHKTIAEDIQELKKQKAEREAKSASNPAPSSQQTPISQSARSALGLNAIRRT